MLSLDVFELGGSIYFRLFPLIFFHSPQIVVVVVIVVFVVVVVVVVALLSQELVF